MNEVSGKKLEYDKIKLQLISFTMSPGGKTLAERHQPSTDGAVVKEWLTETVEAAKLLQSGKSVPLSAMEGIETFLGRLGKGNICTERELEQLAAWLNTIGQMKRYMNEKRQLAPTISGYSDSLQDFPAIREDLQRCIRNGVLTDEASTALAHARRQITLTESKIERKVSQTLTKYKNSLQEHLVSRRNGHYVLPVKRESRKQVPGTVWDESASGQTVFIEPEDVGELHVEMQMWKAEEDRERMIVLSKLSEMVDSKVELLIGNLDVMAALDFIFARAKLSLTWDGIRVRISAHPVIKLVNAKHPLLGKACNPISVSIGWDWRQLIITGPNAGGKTITLKTIGLLAMMVQSGLLVPAEEGTVFGIFEHVFADVGDGQSIEHSLSTFSAHMAAIKEMLDVAGKRSLLLLDELAAGTDPSEGISLSIALLEELLGRESLVAATTHFNEIKRFAAHTPGCANARMAFDPVTLRSLYRLEIGEAGDSFAFAIARRFGLPEHVIARAELRMAIGDNDRNEEWSDKGSKKKFVPLLEEDGDEDEGDEGQYNRTIKHSYVEKGQGTGKVQQEEIIYRPLQAGDSIWIPLMKCVGTVEQPPNSKDEVIVQAMSKRLTLHSSQISRDIP
ncbi:endonuclease MutS2 [Paenibacillus fonticola]|uniref:endonuclease MutS2 n=1 Tax=Paenibacillus fonticola TaxID=379896 RepID=UPI00035CF124|nr:hypothetical protein [Paenibacillus fonticola]